MGTIDDRSRSGGDGSIRNASRQACLSGAIGLVVALSAPCVMGASSGALHGAADHGMQGMESEHMMSALPGSKSSFALSAIAADDPEPPTDFQLGSLTKEIKTAN